MATGSLIIENAFNKLRDTITHEDSREFTNTTLEDVWSVARSIEREQEARRSLRNVRRIEPFLLFLEDYSKVIEVFCQGYSPMSFIWGPMKLLLQLARQHLIIFDKLLDAYRDIADALPRIDRLQNTFGENEDFKKCLSLVYVDILDFHQRAYKMFRNRAWHLRFVINWGLFEHRFQAILNNLRKHRNNLDQEAAALHYQQMKELRERSEREIADYEDRRQLLMVRDILEWLSADEDAQEEISHRLENACHPGTCDWIFSKPSFLSWMSPQNRVALLWLEGKPGSGKSYVCSQIVRYLQEKGKVTCAYYFCNHRMLGKDTVSNVLRTLAVYILRENLDLVPFVHEGYYVKGCGRSAISLRKMLKEIMTLVFCVRIVIDGFDECDEAVQKELLGALTDVQNATGQSCKLLIASRPDHSTNRKEKIRLHEETVNAIQTYIRTEVRVLRETWEVISEDLGRLIEEHLIAKANGMFLWVRLVISNLKDQDSLQTLQEALYVLPDGLDEAYDRILARIKNKLRPRMRDMAQRILHWVACSQRPLRVCEIENGIILGSGRSHLGETAKFRQNILEICGPILEERSGRIIDVVHLSAKEYLLHLSSGPFVQSVQAHCDIGYSCVAILRWAFDISKSKPHQETFDGHVVEGNYTLHAYASQFWIHHVRLHAEGCSREGIEVDQALVEEMTRLSQAHKDQHRLQNLTPVINGVPQTAGVEKSTGKCDMFSLIRRPQVQILMQDCIMFQNAAIKKQHTFNSISDYQEWCEKSDPTVLSVLENRIESTVEDLFNMSESRHPTHISSISLRGFKDLYAQPFLVCRMADCSRSKDGFASFKDRDEHEESHFKAFACGKCDFSARGFPTRRALKVHNAKYHMEPEDYSIPSQISARLDPPLGSTSLDTAEIFEESRLDFSTLDTGDVLENFDFDSFLNGFGDFSDPQLPVP